MAATATNTQAITASDGATGTFRSRLFARLWKYFDDPVDATIRPAKDALLRELPDRVVEIGPGRGSNFSYYGPGKQVVAIEPNAAFHNALAERAQTEGIEVEIRAGDLRAAGLPSESEDVIVSTLVLCSVGDVDAELAEIKRVLKPGGRLIFIEHIVDEPGSVRHYAQKIFRRPWRFVADGCDMCADTKTALHRAGFAQIDATLERLGPVLDPTTLVYWGTAVR